MGERDIVFRLGTILMARQAVRLRLVMEFVAGLALEALGAQRRRHVTHGAVEARLPMWLMGELTHRRRHGSDRRPLVADVTLDAAPVLGAAMVAARALGR